MLKRLFVFAVATVCFVLAGLIGWLVGVEFYGGHASRQSHSAPVLGQAPQYSGLTDQTGHTVDSSQFKGKVQVVTFLFPYCTTYCPLIAAHLVGFEHLLKDSGLQSKVAVVAFNVDPAGTGPKQMRAFLKEYGWDPSDRHFEYLTGKPKQIRHVVRDGFHIDYEKVTDSASAQDRGPQQTPQPEVVNPLAQKANVNYDISHNDGMVIVGPHGHIRKIFDQADVVSNHELLKAVKPLLPAGGSG